MGGYFPIGPFGKTRLWHGGMHINLNEGAPVFCPFPGRIVAARNGDDVAIGSRNFVLTRHAFGIGGQNVTFFLLFMHLEREDPASPRAPGWLQGADKAPFWKDLQADEVAYPDVDVSGGDLIGRVGHAGPPGNFEGQIHVEVIAPEELGQKLQPGFWRAIDAGRSGHFCDVAEIVQLIDRPRGRGDGMLSEPELRGFFQREDGRAKLRELAVRFQSEWGADPGYEAALLRSKDFARLPRAARGRLFRDQIEPTLWWTEELAAKVGLPRDFIAWHYHPVRFIAWMNQVMRERAAEAAHVEAGKQDASVQATAGYDGEAGYTADEDELTLEAGRKLTLEDLARGYPEESK